MLHQRQSIGYGPTAGARAPGPFVMTLVVPVCTMVMQTCCLQGSKEQKPGPGTGPSLVGQELSSLSLMFGPVSSKPCLPYRS